MINEWLSSYRNMGVTVFAVAAGSFFLAGAWFEIPVLDDSEAAKEMAWNLDSPAEGNLQGFHIILSASTPWGRTSNVSSNVQQNTADSQTDSNSNTASGESATDSSVIAGLGWSFKGVVQMGRVRYVLLSDTKEGKVTAYRESETLPDGSQVVAIGADYFTLRRKSETSETSESNNIKLFKLFHAQQVL